MPPWALAMAPGARIFFEGGGRRRDENLFLPAVRYAHNSLSSAGELGEIAAVGMVR
jgi:hypothetical protein